MASSEAPTTITGKYVIQPNPCTTEPCLPGMVYAVERSGQITFLTNAGRWIDRPADNWSWKPQLGDSVTVVGRVGRLVDIHGEACATIEVESIQPGN